MAFDKKAYDQSPRGKAVNYAACQRWRAANRPYVLASYKRHDLKRYYNMTQEDWDRMFMAQGRRCAVCKTLEPGRKNGQWSTDHDHQSNKVRGILCNGCNLALGHTKDDPSRLRLLAEYLEDRSSPHSLD